MPTDNGVRGSLNFPIIGFLDTLLSDFLATDLLELCTTFGSFLGSYFLRSFILFLLYSYCVSTFRLFVNVFENFKGFYSTYSLRLLSNTPSNDNSYVFFFPLCYTRPIFLLIFSEIIFSFETRSLLLSD